MTLTNSFSPEMLEMLPDHFYAGTFDLMVRDADSVAVFWDVARTAVPPHPEARLSLRVADYAGIEEMLILNQIHGHMLVPVYGSGTRFTLALGWSDKNGFTPIASEAVELPPSLPVRQVGVA